MTPGLGGPARKRAFELARTGQVSDLQSLSLALEREGFSEREVRDLLATRDLRRALLSACRVARASQAPSRPLGSEHGVQFSI